MPYNTHIYIYFKTTHFTTVKPFLVLLISTNRFCKAVEKVFAKLSLVKLTMFEGCVLFSIISTFSTQVAGTKIWLKKYFSLWSNQC